MNLSETISAVEDWLRGEHDYQFSKFDRIYGEELAERRDYIALHEMRNKWHSSVILRSGGATLLANQMVLKVCAGNRAVIIYDACLAGTDRSSASEQTLKDLHHHFAQLNAESLPSENELYDRDYERVFGEATAHDRMLRAGELAVVGLMEGAIDGSLQIPTPSRSSGHTN